MKPEPMDPRDAVEMIDGIQRRKKSGPSANNWIGIAQWMALAFLLLGVLGMGLQLAGILGSNRSPEPDSPIILAALILVPSIGLAAIAWLFFALVRARQERGHRFVLLSLVLALAINLTALGILLVVLIGRYDVVALTGQDLITYRLYLGTAVGIGILSLGFFLSSVYWCR